MQTNWATLSWSFPFFEIFEFFTCAIAGLVQPFSFVVGCFCLNQLSSPMQYVYNTIFTQSPKAFQQSYSRASDYNSIRPLEGSTSLSTSDKRYQLVDDILGATSYYTVLGVTKQSSAEEIRRAYIKVGYSCASILLSDWHFLTPPSSLSFFPYRLEK